MSSMAKKKTVKQIRRVRNIASGFADEFIQFMKAYGVIGLAVGFVMGAAIKDYVKVLVNDLINPLIGLFIPDLASLAEWKVGAFGIGNF